MLFLGILYERSREKEILKLSKSGLSNAVNRFQWNLIKGINENMDEKLEIISVLPVGTYPKFYKKLLLKTCKWQYDNMLDNIEIGTINIPFLKQFMRYIKVKKEITKRINQGKNIDNIIIYSTYLPFLRAVYKLNNKINITLVVADLPEFYDFVTTGLVRRILRKVNNTMIYRYLSRINKFVLLTEEMKFPLKVGNRPYVVVEGMIESSGNEENKTTFQGKLNNNKIILYTGTLHYKFGIGNLLEAFKTINCDGYELWLCGSGDAEHEIKLMAKQDDRIKFFGYLTSEEISELQQKCTVLINPRQSEGEYTKYSFPSKTMEYLLSGKPVIAYKLEGIPIEYDNYICYVKGYKPIDLTNKIIEICEKSDEEREKIGNYSREFVLREKNNKAQTLKIIKMIQEQK